MYFQCLFVKALLFLALLASTPLNEPLFAQHDGSLDLSADHLGQKIDLSKTLWRYHPGDDLAWADPAFDDANWVRMASDFYPDSLAEGVWSGIGWFRLHLHVDSTLYHQALALSIYHLGASEIYLDGTLLGAFGEVGASAGTDRPTNPKGMPLSLYLDGRAEHVLAVRYTNRGVLPLVLPQAGWDRLLPFGFFIEIAPLQQRIRRYIFAAATFFADGLIGGILLLMAFLHLVLYAFDPRERANLYLCLWSLSGFFVLYALTTVVGSTPFSSIHPQWALRLLLASLFSMGFFLIATLQTLFYKRLLWFLWVYLLIVVVVYALAFGTLQNRWYTALPLTLIMIESMRVVVQALRRKQEAAWIVAVGVVLFLLISFTMRMTGVGIMTARTVLPEGLVHASSYQYLGFFYYLPLPIMMSVFLARRFAQRSRRLEEELVRVETLSAQTLAQEREKQALIATQNERLEAEVAERTAALKQSIKTLKATQAQLIQQEKMASLGQLTAGIAHEIKNPLNFVNNFAEVNEELAQELREAIAAGEALTDIVDDLEQNARVIAQHGKRADAIVHAMMQHASGGTGRREATDINQLVSEHIDLAYHGKRAQLPDFAVEVKRALAEEVGSVEIVPQEIGRVLLNLLGNAFDAVHEHAATVNGVYTPTVAVSTQRSEGQVEIRVSDNGVGIPPSVRDKIFEPFFTTKPTGSGTGLGLSLSYDIITQGHGGTLTVESAEGEGATFIVTLPVNPAEAAF